MKFAVSLFTLLLGLGFTTGASAADLKLSCDNLQTKKRELLVLTSSGDLMTPIGTVVTEKDSELEKVIARFPDFLDRAVLTGVIEGENQAVQVVIENAGKAFDSFFIFNIEIQSSAKSETWASCAQIPFRRAFH